MPENALSEGDYNRLEQLEDKVVELHLKMQSFNRRTGGEAISDESTASFNQVVEERDELRARLEAGVDRPSQVATLLWYVALGLLMGGIVMVLLATNQS